MIRGFLGKKIGMSQIFAPNGGVIPVTVIQAGPCTVTQVKTKDSDGYEAVQLGFDEVKRLNKPEAGHLKGNPLCRHLREVKADDVAEYKVGQRVLVDIFKTGEKIDVIGKTKGRGFTGTVKRHGFAGGPRTHGQSDRMRAPGSIGAGTFPGRIFKGLRMAGHHGDERVTVKNLEVVLVDTERNLLMVKGGVPGGPNSLLYLRKTNKAAGAGK